MQSEIATEGREPRSFIEEARRKQIVASAIETLGERGFAGTSLAAIARRAGVSKGVISYHFAGKREVIEEVIAQAHADQSSFLDRFKKDEGSATARLHLYIQGSFDFMKKDRNLVRALMEIFLNFRKPDGTSFYDVSSAEPTLSALEAILREGQAEGEFAQFSPRVMAISLRGVINALAIQLSLHPDIDLDAYAAEVMRLFDRATRRQWPVATQEDGKEAS